MWAAPSRTSEIKAGLDHDIEELVADPESAWELQNIAADAGKSIRIHLDINSSGMSRHSLDVSTPFGREDVLLHCANSYAAMHMPGS